MNVEAILQVKGRDVATIAADASIETAIEALKNAGVGALVVSEGGKSVGGIISERDVVRGLVDHGVALLDMKTAELMTRKVRVGFPSDSVDDVMAIMTESRIRHLPIVVDDELLGIVSIGDVVKARLNELKNEADALRQYIAM